MTEPGGFGHFIGGLHDLHVTLRRELRAPGRRPSIAVIARRALAQLRGYEPENEYEAIFVEAAITEYEELPAATGEAD